MSTKHLEDQGSPFTHKGHHNEHGLLVLYKHVENEHRGINITRVLLHSNSQRKQRY